jgi:plasmid stabilization system protein ParE
VIVEWADEAISDVERLYLFLAGVGIDAAGRVAERLESAPDRLLSHPRIGARLDGFTPREIRRIIVGKHEMRYQVSGDIISIVRVFRSREDRPFGEV